MGTKNATSSITASKLLAVLLAVVLALTITPAVAFAGTTGDDGAYYADSTVPNAPDCSMVEWNGLTWDIIGYNTGSFAQGIAGPSGTATLLLDKSFYNSSLLRTEFDSSSPYSDEYSGSTLQTKLNSIYNGFSDKNNVTARSLAGGSALSNDIEGYNGNTVAGNAVSNQSLWPLSTTEVSQLKASVRSFGDDWWLRSPGTGSSAAAIVYYDGYVNSNGLSVGGTNSSRPALYLKLSSSIFTSLSGAISNGTLKIGAFGETIKVTDAAGYTWDIVGVNGMANKGVATPNGYATLLLSNSSTKKFGFPNQSYAGKIYGRYDVRSSGYNNEYATSDLKSALTSAYDTIKDKTEYGDNVKPRDLEGGGTYNDGSEKVAGTAVIGQGLWPLSIAEANTLSNQERIGVSSWLRSPGRSYDDVGFFDYSGYVNSSGYVVGTCPFRPALYLNLSSSIFASLPANWQNLVGSGSGYSNGSQDLTYEYDDLNLPMYSPWLNQTGTTNIIYGDKYWDAPSSNYNNLLAQYCQVIAAGAHSKDSVRKVLEQAGFTDIEVYNYYNGAFGVHYDDCNYDSDTVNGAGYAFGRKTVELKEGTFNLIVVAISGSQGNPKNLVKGNFVNKPIAADGADEWTSNAYIGYSTEHAGFTIAKTQLYSNLQAYSSGISNKKLLITGHSRGAAVANLLAKKIDAEGVLASKNDVYAYTFATPNTTKNTAGNYDNIFNIINPIDPVPYLPFNGPSWSGLSDALKKVGWDYIEGWDKYGVNRVIQDTVADHAYEDSNLKWAWVLVTAGKQWNNPYYKVVEQEFQKITNGMLLHNEVARSGGIPIDQFRNDIKKENGDIGEVAQTLFAHSPLLYLSWLKTVPPATDAMSGSFRTIHCPVDVEVYDPAGNLVAKVANNKVSKDVAGDPVYVFVIGEQKNFYIHSNQAYTVKMIGTDSGKMDYEVFTKNLATGGLITKSSYTDVSIAKGKVFKSEYNSIKKIDELFVTEIVNGSEKKISQVKPNGKETSLSSISLNANGGKIGKAFAASKAVTLSKAPAKATVAKKTGYKFLGYYTKKAGGTKVFDAKGNPLKNAKDYTDASKNWVKIGETTLYAHWQLKKGYKQVTFKVNGGKALAAFYVKKAVKTGKKVGALPKAAKVGYKFKGWYTKKKGGTKIKATTKIKKTTVCYACWKKK